jgi:metal-sulfur cluster biosynthetic enzyme
MNDKVDAVSGGMHLVDRAHIEEVLKGINDPHTGQDVITGGFIQEMQVDGETVKLVMRPPEGEEHCPQYVPLAVEVKRAVKAISGVGRVDATLICHMQERAVNEALRMMDE